ncbi:MAG: type IX secretion system sortase PorU [Actinobacteria bacterium]|nr:type IX secretion system sortase PorU [Actinomycetota bacterium]
MKRKSRRTLLSRQIPTSNESGLWFKIAIGKEGIYQIDGQRLQELGVSTDGVNAGQLQIYYGGGRELNPQLTSPTPALRQIATRFWDKNRNGLFDANDALLFYAQSASGWEKTKTGQRHYINHYTNENIYWLHVGQGERKKMSTREINKNSNSQLQVVHDFLARQFEEKEKTLPGNSGIDWMWDVLSGSAMRRYPVYLNDVIADKAGKLLLRLKGLGENHHLLDIYLNGQFLKNVDISYTLGKTVECDLDEILQKGKNTLMLRLQGDQSSVGFDWYELTFWQHLTAVDSSLTFSSSARNGKLQYEIDGFNSDDVMIYDISDPFSVTQMAGVTVDTSTMAVTFVDSVISDDERYYIALIPQKYQRPASILPVAAGHRFNLLSTDNEADYLIITHESLLGPEIDRLAAHRQNPSYWPHHGIPKVQMITTSDIYDQFSNGLVDPVAIRNFFKYAFENWNRAPGYVLLVGDATFDYKDNLNLGLPLLVPSYENNIKVSDDWFVNLTNDRKMDMIIGRLPVKSTEELAVVVEKIINYDTSLPSGRWRSVITLLADDSYRKQDFFPEDMVFLRDTEKLANLKATQDFDLRKIYLNHYSWNRVFDKPLAKADFISTINQGTLYINFLGHANWNMFAHENLFRTPIDLAKVQNGSRLPLFFAGTCEMALLDDPRIVSSGEYLLLHPQGGAISCIGSARWTMHAASFRVNEEFYQRLFADSTRAALSIGQTLLEAKTMGGFPDQTEIMFLLGDPAQRLAIPKSSIALQVHPDSIALTKRVTIKGEVQTNGNRITDFDGICSIRLYDSAVNMQFGDIQYKWPGKLLYKGVAKVKQGFFESDFFTTADTSAGGQFGRVAACAWQENIGGNSISSFVGSVDSLYVQTDSLIRGAHRDSIGPNVSISIAGMEVTSGESDITVTTPFSLEGRIVDQASGIFQPFSSVYSMTLKIDGETLPGFEPNQFFHFEDNNKSTGRFSYKIEELPVGKHTLSFTVWDNALNPGFWNAEIMVIPKDLSIRNVLSYPNPSQGATFFTFDLSCDCEITINIYTVAGRRILSISGFGERGFNSFPEEPWNCTDADGDPLANGVYLYKIIAHRLDSPFIRSEGSDHSEAFGKLIIAR